MNNQAMTADELSQHLQMEFSKIEPNCKFKVEITKKSDGLSIYKLQISPNGGVIARQFCHAKWHKQSTSPEVIIDFIRECMKSFPKYANDPK